MKAYQREFIEFALEKEVLKFGEFTLKSGRKSPYFFNAGLFNTGRDLARLGRFYAAALADSGIEFDVLFGLRTKGFQSRQLRRLHLRITTISIRLTASTVKKQKITAKAVI